VALSHKNIIPQEKNPLHIADYFSLTRRVSQVSCKGSLAGIGRRKQDAVLAIRCKTRLPFNYTTHP